jgi:hypothetical protein
MEYIKREETKFVENKGDVLACRYFHALYPNGIEAIGDCEAKEIDSKPWDVFHIYYETKDAYYGTPMLGLGLCDCMILKSDTRPFLENEMNYNVGMYGSHTGKYEISWNVNIVPIVNKL